MFLIDTLAAKSRFRSTHPLEKLGFTIISFLLVFVSGKPLILLLVFIVSFGLTLFSGIRFKDLTALLTLPLFFIFTGAVSVMFRFLNHPSDNGIYMRLFGVFIGIDPESFYSGMEAAVRSMTLVTSVYFFILTTPVYDVDRLLGLFKIPRIFRELFILVYRYIFVLQSIAGGIRLSQKSRYGYRGVMRSIQSLSLLGGALLGKSIEQVHTAVFALKARGYTGEFVFLDQPKSSSIRNWILITGYGLLLVIINRGMEGLI